MALSAWVMSWAEHPMTLASMHERYALDNDEANGRGTCLHEPSMDDMVASEGIQGFNMRCGEHCPNAALMAYLWDASNTHSLLNPLSYLNADTTPGDFALAMQKD